MFIKPPWHAAYGDGGAESHTGIVITTGSIMPGPR
jgi:hypothetical protein